MKTTLNKIREHKPCADGWKKLLQSLNKTVADDEPLSLITILDSNGLDDTLWCLRAVDGHKKEMRLYAVWCARQVQHLMTDKRSLDALDVAEQFANGDATQEEMDAAWATAGDAAWAAGNAAWAASNVARAAAWDAASNAAWTVRDAEWAAGDAAWAAGDAAWAAARDAVRAASNALKAAQEVKFREMFGVEE